MKLWLFLYKVFPVSPVLFCISKHTVREAGTDSTQQVSEETERAQSCSVSAAWDTSSPVGSQLSITTSYSHLQSGCDPTTTVTKSNSKAHKTFWIFKHTKPPSPCFCKIQFMSMLLFAPTTTFQAPLSLTALFFLVFFLIQLHLSQSSTNYNKLSLKFPMSLTTTLQHTSGFLWSLCT